MACPRIFFSSLGILRYFRELTVREKKSGFCIFTQTPENFPEYVALGGKGIKRFSWCNLAFSILGFLDERAARTDG